MDLYPQAKFLLIVVLFPLLSGCVSSIRPGPAVVARINGLNITSTEIKEELKQFHFQQFHGGRKEGKGLNIRKFLDKVIDKRLIIQEAKRAELDQGPWFQEPTQKHPRKYKEDDLYRLFLEKIVKPQIQISSQEIERYYHDNPSLFMRSDIIFLEQMLIKDLSLAHQIHQELIQGADFAYLGKVRSTDKIIRYSEKWIQIQNIRPEFRDYLSPLVEGEISSPFHYGADYFIFKVKRKKAGSLAPFDMVKKQIKKKLALQKFYAIIRDYIVRLRESSEIVIYDDALQKLIAE